MQRGECWKAIENGSDLYVYLQVFFELWSHESLKYLQTDLKDEERTVRNEELTHRRHRKFRRCIPSTSRLRNWERRCGRNLKGIDLSIRLELWICYYSRVMRSIRLVNLFWAERGISSGLDYSISRALAYQKGTRILVLEPCWELENRKLCCNTGTNLLIWCSAGNVELLETITAHSQVLPSRRRPKCTTTPEFHEWFLRSRSCLFQQPFAEANNHLGPQLSLRVSSIAVHIPINQVELRSFPCQYAMQCFTVPCHPSRYHSILFAKSCLALLNLSSTISHKSIKSSKPFSSAWIAVVFSVNVSAIVFRVQFTTSMTHHMFESECSWQLRKGEVLSSHRTRHRGYMK